MATIAPVAEVSDQRKRWPAESCFAAGSREQRQTRNAVDSRARARKPLAAGVFQPQISSFRLALAAEGKAAKTVRNDTERGAVVALGIRPVLRDPHPRQSR